jgi:hypothetical protein
MPTDDQPRFAPLLLTIAVLAAAAAYVVPLVSTGDPLWILPTRTEAERIEIYWQATQTSIPRDDPRYRPLMDALNEAFTSPTGLELNYGLHPSDVEVLRMRGRALEALYAHETQAHGRYPLGPFTRVLVPLEGDAYARRLLFVGDDEHGYRAGPIRSPSPIERLRALVEGSR